jgi:LPXTG-site transpeptidase (sortase) family protein
LAPETPQVPFYLGTGFGRERSSALFLLLGREVPGFDSETGRRDSSRNQEVAMSKARKRGRPLTRLLGYAQALLVTAGVGLIGAYLASRLDAADGSAQALAAFSAAQARAGSVRLPAIDALPSQTVASVAGGRVPTGLPVTPAPDQSLWSESRRTAYRESLEAGSGAPAGVLRIPRLGLEVPIFDGTGELNLNRGVGHIEGTALPGQEGNLGIAGHRDGFFRVLKDIEAGDVITVRTLDGDVHYRVQETLVVDPQDVYVLAPTKAPTITLVTCYPFYMVGSAPRRFIVRGARIEAPESA